LDLSIGRRGSYRREIGVEKGQAQLSRSREEYEHSLYSQLDNKKKKKKAVFVTDRGKPKQKWKVH